MRRRGGIGIRDGFKIHWPSGHVGSIPTAGTNLARLWCNGSTPGFESGRDGSNPSGRAIY